MEGFDGNPGTSRLASVLCRRMKMENASPPGMEFGTIQANGSLLTDTFKIPIPKGDYSVCRLVGGLSYPITEGEHSGHNGGDGSHRHTAYPPKIRAGDRVLVVWVQNEAVVVDVILKS